jgi:hypothetical protein
MAWPCNTSRRAFQASATLRGDMIRALSVLGLTLALAGAVDRPVRAQGYEAVATILADWMAMGASGRIPYPNT